MMATTPLVLNILVTANVLGCTIQTRYPITKRSCRRTCKSLMALSELCLQLALGMGVNMVGVNTMWHYGTSSSLEDDSQESG